MPTSQEQLRADLRRVELQLNSLSSQLGANQFQPPSLSSPFPTLTPLTPNVPPSAVNLCKNGEFAHSNDTWYNPPPGTPTSDAGNEAAFWWANDPPVVGQLLDFTTSPTDPNNTTLKTVDHSDYNPEFPDWDRSNGLARLTGDKTIDALLPNNRVIIPNRSIAYFGALIALRNSTIVVPADLRLFASVWDNTYDPPDRPDFAKGTDPFRVDSLVRGTPASTTERRYKILALTDRGYSYLSEEETVLNAPSDASYSTSDVLLSWAAIPGILQYKVYRFDVTAAKYRLLSEIGSGANTYVDNGAVLNDDVGGYPSGTSNTPQAYVATLTDALLHLPVDGEPWVNLFLNIPIPSDYDTQTTEGEQVLRIGMTKALDREMSDALVTNASANLFSDSGDFTSLDAGRPVVVTDLLGNELSTTIAAYVDQENVTMTDVWPFADATDAIAFIEGGGDHGLLIDAVHLSYVPGSAFAPYPDDLNRLENGGQNPITAPRSSSQGGAGGGGGTGGGQGGIGEFGCIALDCPVQVLVGNAIETLTWKAIQVGEVLFSGDLRPNQVFRKPRPTRTLNLHIVRVKVDWLREVEIRCSPAHRIITNFLDAQGRAVQTLRRGDFCLISVGGHVLRKQIVEIVDTGIAADVASLSLTPGHLYFAGAVRYKTWLHRLIARLFKSPLVAVGSHNLKPFESV